MKKSLASLFAMGTLASGLMLAQGPPMRGGRGGSPPDAATMVANQVERLTDRLTLTAAQQAQATTIFTNAAASETAIRTNLQTARTSLNAAVLKADVASIDNLTAQIGSFTGQELNIQSKAQAAFYKILTADQLAKVSSGRGLGGFGGPGGPGGFRRGGPGPGQ